jgi:hypothetical protein
MRSVTKSDTIKTFHLATALKCGTVCILFIASLLLAACGAGTASTETPDASQVTVTIDLSNKTPVPTAAPFWCGAWVTNTTPRFQPGSQIGVNMKFVRNDNGNPVGVNGAQATATVTWADMVTETAVGQTTSDGLAVVAFTIPSRTGLLNKNNIVTVTFSAPAENLNCEVTPDRAAYFTFVQGSPTAAPTTPAATATATNGPSTPGATPSPTVEPSPTATPDGPGGPGGPDPTPTFIIDPPGDDDD